MEWRGQSAADMGSSSSHPHSAERESKGFTNEVELKINGKLFKVGDGIDSSTSLNAFIREHAHFKGTKYMCLEGGCGTCIVTAQFSHPATHQLLTYAVNSCLVPVFACHGWSITTVEGIGSKNAGYNEIQTRLASANGTQCGYCSPGMVMNMYSLLKQNPKLTMKEIENSFGGNLCRCTGYRSILDGFKTFAVDIPPKMKQKIIDIEEMMVCPKKGGPCQGSCDQDCSQSLNTPLKPVAVCLKDSSQWYRPTTKQQVFEVLDMIGGKSFRYVAGNTAQGVYRILTLPEVYIDLNGIAILHDWNLGSCLTLGGNINLTETMDIFRKVAKQQPIPFSYLNVLADHIDMVAHIPVRNIGTIAGNLMIKFQHHEFPSDIFLILETVGAQIVIEENSDIEKTYLLREFLELDMSRRLITKLILPALDSSYTVSTFKIMPRAQNAHALVNAGFKFKLNKSGNYCALEVPSIVFGNISPDFIHASKTEQYLNGKSLLDDGVLAKALDILSSELVPVDTPPEPSPDYRKGLALSLFYKFALSLNPEKVNPKYKSGAELLKRAVSSGKQDFSSNKSDWPLYKPVQKLEAIIQCAGEAEYTNDIPSFPGEVWAHLVTCDRAGYDIDKIDATEALTLPGVVAFFTAKDIPVNTFLPKNAVFYPVPERVFAEHVTEFAGQVLGLIVAETQAQAIRAGTKVKVSYGKSNPVIFDPVKIIKENITSRITELGKIEPKQKKANVKYTVKGEWSVPGQFHNFMESQTCIAVPTEDFLDVYSAAQWPALVQEAISQALNMPENQLNVRIRRLGGGYGGKITLPAHPAVCCALAAHRLNRPVRTVYTIETSMEWGGKRFPSFTNYELGVDDKGVIQYMDSKMYENDGFTPNDAAMSGTLGFLPSCYDTSTWSVKGYGIKTDSASNTWCRAPGSTEAISTIENIMEHIAHVTGQDSLSVRIANMTPDNPCVEMMNDLKQISDYDNRVKAIEKFNQENRWKKRGISLIPMQYILEYFGNFYAAVSIFKNDGTVAISHSAVEMGQGCNTKAAQVAAFILGVDLNMITVKPIYSNVFPNAFVTGGSMGSESACYAVKMACEEMNTRLKPIKEKLGPSATWKDICKEAYNQEVDLRAQYMFTKNRAGIKGYFIYGTAVSEVEVDILTGQYELLRMDVIEDAGDSLSPEIDIGQVEGAIAMGIGLLTTEELIYDSISGRILTNRTWTYKPPGAKDIAVDLRITLRKNAPNPFGVLRSKATGEPAVCLTNSIVFALRKAIQSARIDAGNSPSEWINIKLPLTREHIWLNSANKIDQYKRQ